MINDQVETPYLRNAYTKQITDIEAEESWDKSNEYLAFYVAKLCKNMMKKHDVMYDHTNFCHKLVMYPVIVLSTVSGAINFNESHVAVKYLTSSISIATAILVSFSKFTNLGQKVESHSRSSLLYDLLYRKIIRELLRKPRERIHASVFINDINSQYDDLIKISPQIEESVVEHYENRYRFKMFKSSNNNHPSQPQIKQFHSHRKYMNCISHDTIHKSKTRRVAYLWRRMATGIVNKYGDGEFNIYTKSSNDNDNLSLQKSESSDDFNQNRTRMSMEFIKLENKLQNTPREVYNNPVSLSRYLSTTDEHVIEIGVSNPLNSKGTV